MKLDIKNLQSSQKQPEVKGVRRPAWYKATSEDKDQYTILLHQKLTNLTAPPSLTCSDVNCQLEEHTRERDSHVVDIMCAIMEASYECIPLSGKPSSGKKKGGNLPGWNENVAPAKSDALFWHAVWLSAGRPPSGALHQVMCNTRNKYHYSVRKA